MRARSLRETISFVFLALFAFVVLGDREAFAIMTPDTRIEVNRPDLSTSEIALSLAVLVFTMLLMLMVLRIRESLGRSVVYKLAGLIVVVGSSLFLMTAGWSQSQVTPVVGLLGTGLGFVFGKDFEPVRRRRQAKTSVKSG